MNWQHVMEVIISKRTEAKGKPNKNLSIQMRNKSALHKQKKKCTNQMFKVSSFEFSFILSKILQIENILNPNFESVYLVHERT